MNYYAVIDTNVVVSSFLKKGSVPDQVISYVMDGPITPFLNEEIINEYREVLLRNKFGVDPQIVERFIDDITKRAYFLDRTPTGEKLLDNDDVVFYEITLTARESKDAYLVTGNTRHFPKEPFIVTPREMLEIIEKGSN